MSTFYERGNESLGSIKKLRISGLDDRVLHFQRLQHMN
jgi:hypothetical protein